LLKQIIVILDDSFLKLKIGAYIILHHLSFQLHLLLLLLLHIFLIFNLRWIIFYRCWESKSVSRGDRTECGCRWDRC